MKVNILCIGKLKEDYYLAAQAEYIKMLGRFCDVCVVELPDMPLSHVKSEKEEAAVKRAEGLSLLEKSKGCLIACDPRGKKMSSEAFSKKLETLMLEGASEVSFLVGGSLGLPQEVLARANLTLSFSDMTLPHRLFRIVLLEQIYRAFKIMRNETYHK